MSKKVILITAAAGLLSFAGAFAFSWFTRPSVQSEAEKAAEAAGAVQQLGSMFGQREGKAVGLGAMGPESRSQAKEVFSERQLKSLVYEIRERIREYNNKLSELEIRERCLATAEETLRKDIEELGNLRVEVSAAVAKLKEQHSVLVESRAVIANSEKANLISIAATYDKMDPASAGKILSNMCTAQAQSGAVRGGSFDDAVKILHYMTERTKAKLLAELVTSEPRLAALLCQRLKQVTEQE